MRARSFPDIKKQELVLKHVRMDSRPDVTCKCFNLLNAFNATDRNSLAGKIYIHAVIGTFKLSELH